MTPCGVVSTPRRRGAVAMGDGEREGHRSVAASRRVTTTGRWRHGSAGDLCYHPYVKKFASASSTAAVGRARSVGRLAPPRSSSISTRDQPCRSHERTDAGRLPTGRRPRSRRPRSSSRRGRSAPVRSARPRNRARRAPERGRRCSRSSAAGHARRRCRARGGHRPGPRRRVPGAARAVRRGRHRPGAARAGQRAVRRGRRHGVGRRHGQGGDEACCSRPQGLPVARGRPSLRASGTATAPAVSTRVLRAGAAAVRQAGQSRIERRHLEGEGGRRARAGDRAGAASSTARSSSRRRCRTRARSSARCSATTSREASVARRDRPVARVLRLRGQVPRRRARKTRHSGRLCRRRRRPRSNGWRSRRSARSTPPAWRASTSCCRATPASLRQRDQHHSRLHDDQHVRQDVGSERSAVSGARRSPDPLALERHADKQRLRTSVM